MKRRNIFKASCLLVVTFHGLASGAVISWSAEGLGDGVGLDGVDAVSTLGTLEYAYNSAGAEATIGGVVFAASPSGGQSSIGGGDITVVNPDNGGSSGGFGVVAGLDEILDSTYWAHRNPNGTGLPDSGGTGVRSTISLNNLVIGQEYLVQVFSSDGRGGSRNNVPAIDRDLATEFISPIGNGNVGTGNGGNGVVLNGVFTADATSQSFTYIYDSLGSNANYNAIQVRVIPEPSSALLLGLTGAGFLVRRRR